MIYDINYWHIQLHKDKKLENVQLKKLLLDKKVIGLGEAWVDKNGTPMKDPEFFKSRMSVGDVVLVRNTIEPIALVQIKSGFYLEKDVDLALDWFPLRRNIEIIGFYSEKEEKLLQSTLRKYQKRQIQALGTLTLCKGDTATYSFIKSWYDSVAK